MQVRSMELRERLLERLETTKQERLATQDVIKSLENKIKAMTQNAPARPRFPPKRLEEEIKKLEYEHTTTSMTKKQEKEHLKEVEALKSQRRLYKGYEASQRNIVRLKKQLDMGKEQVQKLLKTERELGKGLRKVEVTRKIFSLCGVHVAPADVVEESVPYKPSVLPDILGRKGANISKMEVLYKVVLDVDRARQSVQVLGHADHVANAKEAIKSISESIEEEVDVPPVVKKLLLSNDRQRCTELEDTHMVRIRLGNNPNSSAPVGVRGKAEKVAVVKKEFADLLASGKIGQIAKNFVGVIIGKGGSQIRQLESDFSCIVDVGQSSTDQVTVSVFGEQEAMENCWAKINEIVAANTIHTETIDMDAEMIPQFIGTKGANINGIRKRTRANINVDKRSNDVTISGKTNELSACREEIEKFKVNWSKTNWIKIVPVVTGSVLSREKVDEIKKETGAKIQYVRVAPRGLRGAAAREAALKATKSKIIVSGAEEAVTAARSTIEEIISGLAIETIKIASSEIGSVIGPKGSVISDIQSKTKAKLNMEDSEDSTGSICEISGEKSAVAAAKDLVNSILEQFRKENLEIEVHPLVVKALKTERGGRSAGVIGFKTGARVILPKEKDVGSVILRGKEDVIQAAKDMMELVYGKEVFNTASPDMHVVECPVAAGYMGTVIGKGAAGIQELQNENNVVVLVNDPGPKKDDKNKEEKTEKKKSKGNSEETKSYVSIIGLPKGVQSAKMALLARLGRTVKIKVDITARTKSLHKVFGTNLAAALRRVESQCGGSRNVKITVKENPRDCQVSVAGYFNAAQKAKSVIEAAKRGHVVVEIPLISSEHVQFLQDTHAALIAQIQRRNSVTLKLEVDGSHIHISGGKTKVQSAEDGVHNCLQFSFSKNYARFSVNEIFATSLRSNKFEKVKALETETETKIDLSNTHLFIRGEDVTSAQEKVKKLLEAHKHEYAEIPVNQELIGRIIGAKGANIKKLGDESGAKIDINKSSNSVLIRGKPEQVQAAKALIEEIVKTEASRRTQFVVPKESCASIIGKGGETIRRIEGDTNTRLNVDRQSSRVTITGEPEDVIAAKALVDEQVERWTNEQEERRSKMIMERTREGENGNDDSGRGGGSGRGRGRGNEKSKKPVEPPPGLEPAEPEPEAASKPKLDEPRKISGLGPTRNQLKNKKRAQKRAKQRQQDEALDFLTTSTPADVFSADDLLSSLGLDLELPPAPGGSSDAGETTSYYKSAGYSLRLDD